MATESAFTDLTFTLPNSVSNVDTILTLATQYQFTEVTDSGGRIFSKSVPNDGTTGTDSVTVKEFTLIGLCFSPRTISTGTDRFHTVSFCVSLVFRDENNKLAIFPENANAATVITPDTAYASQVTAANQIGQVTNQRGIDLQGNYLASFGDWWYTTKRYNDTREFDYVFLDIEMYKYLSGSPEFYNVNGNTPPVPSQRGLFVTRATYTLPIEQAGQPRYQTFRTLNFAPNPQPVQNLNGFDVNDIAYYLGPTCPPWWRDTGITTTATPQGGTTGGRVQRQALSAEALPPETEAICDCGRINRVELFNRLKESGYITENVQPLRTLPAFIIRILIWLGIVGVGIWGVSKVLPKNLFSAALDQ